MTPRFLSKTGVVAGLRVAGETGVALDRPQFVFVSPSSAFPERGSSPKWPGPPALALPATPPTAYSLHGDWRRARHPRHVAAASGSGSPCERNANVRPLRSQPTNFRILNVSVEKSQKITRSCEIPPHQVVITIAKSSHQFRTT